MAHDLDVIIVNWNVAPLLRVCLQALHSEGGASLDADGLLHLGPYRARVIVVDNASSDDSVGMLRAEFPQVELMVSKTNLGFTGGNNLALRQAHGRRVLLLNPDTQVMGDALERMLHYMDGHPDVAVVGPQLHYGDGTLQSSRRRFPTLATAFLESTLLEQWFPHNRWARRYRMEDHPIDDAEEVDWLVGACLMVRSSAIAQVGLLDERFFMYSEELDWCRRFRAAGWRAIYLPEAVVIHHEGQSSGQVVAARHIRFNTSKVLYFRKHHGRLAAESLRLFLLTTFIVQWLVEAIKYAIGHKRAMRLPRMVAYAQVLRSGLRGVRT